jgi:Nucleoside 2-deoxyribosyltransferase like
MKKMKRIYRAPENTEDIDSAVKTIFLAGSIEMDKAIDWQKQCEEELKEKYIIFNPRRTSWDSSWKQTIDNPQFLEQVNWELDCLEKADIVIMFFANNTMSPISLLEFGLYAKSNKMKVVVEKDFWRKGNIDIVCKKYDIEQFEMLEELISSLKNEN